MYSAELDEAVRSTLRLIDEYLVLQREAEFMLKPGWMNLASARYNLGPGSLTSAAYPATMEALAVVDIRTEEPASTSFELRVREPDAAPIHRPALAENPMLSLSSMDEAEFEAEEEEARTDAPTTRRSQEEDLQSLLQHLQLKGIDDAPQDGQGATEGKSKPAAAAKATTKPAKEIELQQRSHSSSKPEAQEKASTSSSSRPLEPASSLPESKGRRAIKFDPRSDPLHWFGYLVPPSLKEAKGAFKSALPRICEAAALRSKIVRQMEQVAQIRERIAAEDEAAVNLQLHTS